MQHIKGTLQTKAEQIFVPKIKELLAKDTLTPKQEKLLDDMIELYFKLSG